MIKYSRQRASGGASRRGADRAQARGRPPAMAEREVRALLLQVARGLFLRYGYRAVSGRQVAAAAGVNPAMIQYYFRSKRGLYTAMLQDVMTPIATRLEEMLQPAHSAELDLDALLRTFMTTIAENPWIPGLLVREVLNPDGEFRDEFIRNVAGRLAPRLEELLRRAIATGSLRSDLDPKLAVLSFMSLGMWPFVAMPIASRVLGVASEGDAMTQLIEHTLRVFRQGTTVERAA